MVGSFLFDAALMVPIRLILDWKQIGVGGVDLLAYDMANR